MVTREAGPPAKSQWVRSISALTLLLLLASCKGKTTIQEWLASKDALSYAQYTSLEQGTALEAIRTAFGPGEDPLLHEGVTRGLTYACEDSAGNVVPLKLVFDRAGHLEAWALGSEPAKSS